VLLVWPSGADSSAPGESRGGVVGAGASCTCSRSFGPLRAGFATIDTDTLRPVVDDFDNVVRRLDDPWVRPVRLVPWVGRQINTVHGMAEAGSTAVGAGITALDAVDAASLDEPAAALVVAADALTVAVEDLGGIDLPSGRWLIGPVADARLELLDGLNEIGAQLGRYEALANGLSRLSSSESTYLVAAANTSEMGSASGMLLQLGTMQLDAGSVVVSDFVSVGQLGRPSGVEISDSTRLLWATTDPGHLWQYTSHLSSRGSEVARIAADMWEADQGTVLDGVLIIDPVAMQGLLEASGVESIEVGDDTLATDAIADFFALDQYALFDSISDERRSTIAPVASAALLALFQGDSDPRTLVSGLYEAFDSRHLMLWSRDEALQERWLVAGAAGDPAANAVKVAIANVGGNKLDQFLEIDVEVEVLGEQELRLNISVLNAAPFDAVSYVLGGARPAFYSGHLVVNVPATAPSVTSTGTTELNASANDGLTHSFIHIVQLERGEEAFFTFDIVLPQSMTEVVIEPSGRWPGINWVVDGEARRDTRSIVELRSN